MSEGVLGQELSDDQQDSNLGDAGSDNDFDYSQFVENNVGEGKKYATAEDALKALSKKAAHQDTFIETLKLEKQGVEREKALIAEQLESSTKIDDLMKVLVEDDSGKKPTGNQQQGEGEKNVKPLDQDELRSMVKDMLVSEQQAKEEDMKKQQLRQNQNKAFDLLAGENGFGSKEAATRAIQEYIGNDNEKKDLLNRMGSYQPEAVVDFLKLQVKPDKDRMDGTPETKRNVNENYDPGKGMLTWKEVQRVKKENPKLYKDRKFQLRIHKAAADNPKFWD